MEHKGMLTAFCMLFAPIAFAQPVLEDTIRGAQQDGSMGGSPFGDMFGTHVAANDEWLIVGAPREDVDLDNSGFIDAAGEPDVGAAYIYRRTSGGLIIHQKLVGFGRNTVSGGDRFGAGVTLQGNWLFIGAANDNDFLGVDPAPDPSSGPFFFAGKVYVYRQNADTELWEGPVQELTSDEPASLMQFGARTESNHVAAFNFGNKNDPKIVLVGEQRNTGDPAAPPAKLHVFKLKKGIWERIQIATSPLGGVPDNFRFGDGVVRAGNFALTFEEQGPGPIFIGKVHVYRVTPNGIAVTKKVPLPVQTIDAGNSGNVCNSFDGGIGAGGGIVVIGNPCDSTAGTNAGAIRVYSVANGGKNPLTLAQTLFNPMPASSALYGAAFSGGQQSVSTDGETILVGSTSDGIINATLDRDVDIYTRNNGSFSLLTSVPTQEPDADGFFPNTGYGQSVNLIGDDQFTISQMGWFLDGGGRVFKYRLQ